MPKRTDRDHAEILMRKAAQDEAALRTLSASGEELEEAIGFHAQQAVEKRLKAVLAVRNVEFPYIHDLVRLAELVRASGGAAPGDDERLAALSPWAANTRYDEEDLLLDRADAVALVEAVGAWARAELAP